MSGIRCPVAHAACLRLLAVCVALGGLFVLTAVPAGAATLTSEAVIARVHSATLEAHIDPESHDTTCQAQYVSEHQYRLTEWNGVPALPCSPEDLGSGASAVTATVALSGLEISTTYRYRVLMTSEGKTVPGAEETFATFGVERFSFEALDPKSFGINGEPLELEPLEQAGAHPFELTAYIAENSTQYKGKSSPDAILKDALTQLPPGLIGDPAAMPRCAVRVVEENRCPAASEVGILTPYHGVNEFNPSPLFDVIPPEGVAARFAGEINLSTDAYIDAGVRSGSDYGVTAGGYNLPELANVTAFKIVLWGVPNAANHDPERSCLKGGSEIGYKLGCAAEGPERPFLSLPTACNGPQTATASLDSYAAPGEYVSKSVQMPALTGCDQIPFAPMIVTRPTSASADSATGLNVDLHVPQEENPNKTSTADLKNASVTFPPGLVVDPSSADGLGACSQAQVGFTGFNELDKASEPGVQTAQFTPAPAECPDASKLGTVEIDTPLLEHPLPGALYLATPHENPFGSLIAVYLTVYDPISGVVVKLPGKVQANPRTGQLTTTFDQNPQLPFDDLKVDLFPGQRAALTTPLTCGSYATTTDLTPWTSPEGADATPSSSPFQIAEAPGGGACAGSEGQAPNTPGFTAGTVSSVAGSYSPFVLKLAREDGSQHFAALNVTLPPGLIGKIARIEQCPQAAIEAAQHRSHEGEGALEQSSPSCPAGSEVGTVHVGAGSGAPLYVTGHAYFAGPYEGAPFSMVIVTPAVAGPFDLGTVVVRAGLYIDPSTAQVTVKSDPFPTILGGIPLDIRNVAVDINRPDFTLNPTSCNTMTVTGQESSTAGQTASLSDRFQAGGCTTLPFHPSFTASTQGKASRQDGASLDVKVASSTGQANIHTVHVSLPKALPSRQSTLKLACREAVFAANPASCPAGSNVGSATAVTPLLSNPLTGPAYLVSHGGAAFPDLEIVLQGEGITLVLDGKTNIDEHTNITSSTFESVPDAPISTFELNLPEGPHSVLGAPANKLCSEKLTMPTRIVGQNGALIEQATNIAVTGCTKPRALTRTQKLNRALKTCHKIKNKRKRTTCEKQAHKRYGATKKKKK